MEILLPSKTEREWRELLGQVACAKPMRPFENLSLAFIQEISKAIMNKKEFLNPELRQMARWMSEPHLKEIHQSYELRRQNRIWLPRGVVLHFPPANVDSLFVYSWFISLLVGNLNLIRLSQNRNPQVKLILDVLNSVLDREDFKPIRERNLIVSYGHEDAITRELSEFCHLRAIWGGDETIKQIRAVPLPPRANELVFADRFSMAVFKAEAVLGASEEEIDKLVRKIYYDTFYFSQRGCASPKLIFWIGREEEIDRAKGRFWPALGKFTSQEKIDWEKGISIARMVTGYRYAAEGLADKLSTAAGEFPYRVHLQEFKERVRQIHSGGGLFLEAERGGLTEVIDLIVFKDQTLSVYGFSKNELEEFAWQLAGHGIDRIVPVGQALDFHYVWDGYDLFTYLTREVTVS